MPHSIASSLPDYDGDQETLHRVPRSRFELSFEDKYVQLRNLMALNSPIPISPVELRSNLFAAALQEWALRQP